MNKIKLVKRSENVNYLYDDEGAKTEQTNSVSYKIMDAENGNEIGNAECYNGSFNVSVYGLVESISEATGMIEKMFSSLSE